MTHITIDQLAARSDGVLIDVREPDEFATGRVPGARNIPLQQLRTRLAEIPDLSPDLPAAERLAQIYRTVWAGALAEEPVWRLLLGEGIRGEEAALPVGRSLLEVFGPGLAGWIAATVPEVIDPGAVAEVVIGQLFAGFVRHIFEPDRPLAELEDAGAAAVIGAVLPGPTGA